MPRRPARSFARAALASLLLAGCGGAPPPEPPRIALGGPRGAPHVQIVRALPTAERAALAARFRERNGPWAIAVSPTGAPDDIDPIRGVIRRGAREDAPGAAPALLEPEAVTASVAAFLTRNADLLGFPASEVGALDLVARPAQTARWGAWVVAARGRAPMRGYEGFEAVATAIDVLVYVGDDGAPRYFVNLSHVHPRLSIDTTPKLGPDAPELLKDVVGRPVFVVVDDPNRPNARVRELRRIQLGLVTPADVKGVHLTIDVSPGPRFSYVSYTLAYAVDVLKESRPFRFVVDGDTGALLQDAVVPVVNEVPGQGAED
ncbi:MAG: hypothetical protein JWP97_4832 [Labilithrix sp.]|nr:hypothetical protein [Labilithrix sp.]